MVRFRLNVEGKWTGLARAHRGSRTSGVREQAPGQRESLTCLRINFLVPGPHRVSSSRIRVGP
eukprot:13093785-Alexandrium_andersonii.AAC.1